MTSPSHDRPGATEDRLVRLALRRDRDGPSGSPTASTLVFSGNRMAIASAAPGERWSWTRRPAPSGSSAITTRMAPACRPAERPRSTAAAVVGQARPCAIGPGSRRAEAPAWSPRPSSLSCDGVTEIIDAEGERPLGAGARDDKGGDPKQSDAAASSATRAAVVSIAFDDRRQGRERGKRGNGPQRPVDQQHFDQSEKLGEHQELSESSDHDQVAAARGDPDERERRRDQEEDGRARKATLSAAPKMRISSQAAARIRSRRTAPQRAQIAAIAASITA